MLVMRRYYKRWGHKILEGSVDGIKSRGAQRRKWRDNIKDWMNITINGSLKRTAED